MYYDHHQLFLKFRFDDNFIFFFFFFFFQLARGSAWERERHPWSLFYKFLGFEPFCSIFDSCFLWSFPRNPSVCLYINVFIVGIVLNQVFFICVLCYNLIDGFLFRFGIIFLVPFVPLCFFLFFFLVSCFLGLAFWCS